MKKNISSVVGMAILIAMIFVVTGCQGSKIEALKTENARLSVRANDLQKDKNVLTNSLGRLLNENAGLSGRVRSLVAEIASLTNRLETLQTDNVALTNQVRDLHTEGVDLDKMIKVLREQNDILKPLNAALTNQVGELQSTNAALARQVAELNAKLSNAALALAAAPATVPAAPSVAPTNAVIAVVQSATSSLVFYQDGTITTTNAPVGMVGGMPVLIDNVSKKSVTLIIKRLAGRGSITVDVDKNSTYPTVFLLRGQYTCTWRIKGNTEVAGSATLTVNDGDPAELVVGKGVFSATLTLADQ